MLKLSPDVPRPASTEPCTRSESDCYLVRRACVVLWPEVVIQNKSVVGRCVQHCKHWLPYEREIFSWRVMTARRTCEAKLFRRYSETRVKLVVAKMYQEKKQRNYFISVVNCTGWDSLMLHKLVSRLLKQMMPRLTPKTIS